MNKNKFKVTIFLISCHIHLMAQYFSKVYFNEEEYVYGSFFGDCVRVGGDDFFTYTGIPGGTEYIKLNKNGDQLKRFVKNEFLIHPFYPKAVLTRNDSIFIVSFISLENNSMEYAYTILDKEGNELIRKYYKSTDFLGGLRLSFSSNNQLLIYSSRSSVELGMEVIWQRIELDGTTISEFNHFRPGRRGDDHMVESEITQDIDGNDLFISVPTREYLVIDGQDYWPIYINKIYQNDSVGLVSKVLTKADGDPEDIHFIKPDNDGQFILLAARDFEGGFFFGQFRFPFIVKLNRAGDTLWSSNFQPNRGLLDGAIRFNTDDYKNTDLKILANKDILISGSVRIADSLFIPNTNGLKIRAKLYGSYLARFSPDGTLLWRHFLVSQKSDGTGRNVIIRRINELSDGSLLCTGSLEKDENGIQIAPSQAWAMRVGPNGCFDASCSHVDKWWYFPDEFPVSSVDIPSDVSTLSIYPNPTSQDMYISIPENIDFPIQYTVTDELGRTHETGMYHDSNTDIRLEVVRLPSAVYFLQIKDKSAKLWRGKFVKVD